MKLFSRTLRFAAAWSRPAARPSALSVPRNSHRITVPGLTADALSPVYTATMKVRVTSQHDCSRAFFAATTDGPAQSAPAIRSGSKTALLRSPGPWRWMASSKPRSPGLAQGANQRQPDRKRHRPRLVLPIRPAVCEPICNAALGPRRHGPIISSRRSVDRTGTPLRPSDKTAVRKSGGHGRSGSRRPLSGHRAAPAIGA